MMCKENKSFSKRWPGMRPNLLKVIRQEDITQMEWQHLFWDVHAVALWDPQGFDGLRMCLREDLMTYIKESHEEVLKHQGDSALLKSYIREWKKFFAQCTYLPMPFYHCTSTVYDRTVTPPNIREMMLSTWAESIFQPICHRLQASALKLVEEERNGKSFDSQLVIGVRQSFVNLTVDPTSTKTVYQRNFEKPYIDATVDHYVVEAQRCLAENGVYAYMQFADQKLKEELARGEKYLHQGGDSMEQLRTRLVETLIENFMDQMLEKCPELIKTNDTKKLALLHSLMKDVRDDKGITPMLQHLHDFILEQGLADMTANASIITQDCEKYVETLLDLYNRFTKLVEEAFNNFHMFTSQRDRAFTTIINDCSIFTLEMPNRPKSMKTTPESRCPDLLANYTDMLLRKTPLSKKLTSDEIDNRLKDILKLLGYIKNKDVFIRYHKVHLTRRLILGISADNEKEELLVERIHERGLPADPINDMLRMFQDIKVSQDLNQEFKDYQAAKGNTSDVVNIKILNIVSWIKGSDIENVSLPMELEDIIPEIEEFYKMKHSGRKLRWHHQMANGTITFANNVGKFELDITTFQMAVLFAWNQRPLEKISFEGLRLATELPELELRRTLFSLTSFPKIKKQVVLCDEAELRSPKDFTASTNFWINQEFCIIKNNRPQKRGRINLIGRLQLASEKTVEDCHHEIALLRELRTEEGIIKIMKMRKRISYAQLQTELVEILKGHFSPSRKLIKECIEKLISDNHIARNEQDLNEYMYIA